MIKFCFRISLKISLFALIFISFYVSFYFLLFSPLFFCLEFFLFLIWIYYEGEEECLFDELIEKNFGNVLKNFHLNANFSNFLGILFVFLFC